MGFAGWFLAGGRKDSKGTSERVLESRRLRREMRSAKVRLGNIGIYAPSLAGPYQLDEALSLSD